jgi:monoamine oxidase
MHADVIVIGAGISGVAAAGELARRGWNVRVLEARDHIGGRLLSAARGSWPHPVELGAEYVHGGSRALRALLRQARLSVHPVNATMWWKRGNAPLQPIPDFWTRIRRVAARIPRRNRRRSFVQFLREEGRTLSPEDRHLAQVYVASFNAAPPAHLSAHAMRIAHAGADTGDLRLIGRYDTVVRALQRNWPDRRVELRLDSIVTSVQWQRGGVAVTTRGSGGSRETHRASAVVVTLPLGVLQAGSVRFDPPLKNKQRAIDRMGWGHVHRVLLRFRPGFWRAPFLPPELAGGSGRAFGFVNAPAEAFPVWWVSRPPAPVLTGWAGGPAALKLDRRPSTLRQAALRSLANILETRPAQLQRQLLDSRAHDWSRDPFVRGAYSFVAAGAESAADTLAEPVQDTLFFAGEATASDTGTVHGALESGLRSAKEAAAALNRRRRAAVGRTVLSLF